MTRHHPDTLTLMEYSAGNLSEPHALCIRLHLDQCSHCRSRVDTLDSLGAVMMENQPKVGVSADMFDSILSRIDSEPDMTEKYIDMQANRMSPLQKLLGDNLNDLPWKRQLGDVNVLDISERFPGQNEQVVLQKLAAGGRRLSIPIAATRRPSCSRGRLQTRKACSTSGILWFSTRKMNTSQWLSVAKTALPSRY